MATTDPLTPEGQVWLQQFNGHLANWVQSGREDDVSLTHMGESLEHLFERCPDYAATVQSVALSATFLARQGHVRPAAIPLATTGLTAASVRADDPADTARRTALQALYLAEIHLDQGRQFEGLDALKRVRKALDDLPEEDTVAIYAHGLSAQLEGGLYELGLEHERAGDAYFEAAEYAQPVVDGDIDGFSVGVLETVMGADGAMSDFLPQLMPLVSDEQRRTLVKARLGLARTTLAQIGDSVTEEEAKDTTKAALAAFDKYGIPDDIDVSDVFQTIGTLTPRQATIRANKMIRWAKEAHSDEFNDWKALLHAAVAHCKTASGDEDGAAKLFQEAGEDAELASPLIAALARGFDFLDNIEQDDELSDDLAEGFIFALTELQRTRGDALPELRMKALLDEPVAAAVHWAFRQFKSAESKESRLQLGLLIDSLRQPCWWPSDFEFYDDEPSTLHRAREAYQLSLDRLQRIAYALRTRPGTAVVVLQGGPANTLFLCVTSDDQPITGYSAKSAYRNAARQLAQAAVQGLASGTDSSGLEKAGKKLFNALPKAVRKIIDTHDTLLLAPDLRSDEDSIPFELMHDGESFIGLSKVISRLASLRDIVSAIEPRRSVRGKSRALITCAPEVPGYPTLQFADDERASLCESLTAKGWDAPTIDSARLTPDFILERLKYVSLLHLSAHGEVSTGDEAVLLPGGKRLVAEDLLRNRFPGLPFVYLNTCLLGHIRYLGGGVSRGMAHTMFELGAPAVVANLSPVYDKVALDLSQAFYRHALAHPVGEALRLARCELADNGVPSLLWGTTILIGDPLHDIAPDIDDETDAMIDMLDNYMNLDPNPDMVARADSYSRVRDDFYTDPTNNRLGAALSVVHVMSELDYSDPVSDEESVDYLIGVVNELNHLPSMALMQVVKTNHLLSTGVDNSETIASLEQALVLLDALRDEGGEWGRLRQDFLARKKAMELEELGLEAQYHGEWSEKDRNAANALLASLRAAQSGQEFDSGAITLRTDEVAVEDIAWNAIVIGYPDRFEDMREQTAYASQLTDKLVQRKFIPAAAADSARLLLAGLLYDLWGRQHSVGLEPELVQGWTGTVLEAIADLAENWSPPGDAVAFEKVSVFPGRLDETLEFLDACSWEEIYKHMDDRFDALSREAESILESVRAERPNALAGCYAWLLGAIMVRNNFSPLDGSVPESIGERMDQLATSLWSHGEGYLMRYLADGFKSMRQAEWDELQRWKVDMTPDEYLRLQESAAKLRH